MFTIKGEHTRLVSHLLPSINYVIFPCKTETKIQCYVSSAFGLFILIKEKEKTKQNTNKIDFSVMSIYIFLLNLQTVI